MEGVQVRAGLNIGALVSTVALCAMACGPGPHVEGSVGELLDLRYSRAEARMAETFVNQGSGQTVSEKEVSVRFIATQGTVENTPLKVSARLANTTFVPGTAIDLAEKLPDGAQRGTVTRSVLDEPVRAFPAIERGSLLLHGEPTSGSTVEGEFNVTFVNGTDVYSGRTLFGRFEATVP